MFCARGNNSARTSRRFGRSTGSRDRARGAACACGPWLSRQSRCVTLQRPAVQMGLRPPVSSGTGHVFGMVTELSLEAVLFCFGTLGWDGSFCDSKQWLWSSFWQFKLLLRKVQTQTWTMTELHCTQLNLAAASLTVGMQCRTAAQGGLFGATHCPCLT